MLNKVQTIYVCSNCGAQFPKWSGRCLECGGWGTLRTETVNLKAADKAAAVSPAELVDLKKLDQPGEFNRRATGIQELDRVLGDGLVAGSLILLGGEPGIGKSTLVAQIAACLSDLPAGRQGRQAANGPDGEVIYVSGEESASQIKNRFNRLMIPTEKIKFLSETNAEKIIATANQLKPVLVIIDSIQTIYSSIIAGEAGSLNQIRGATVSFLETAKQKNIAIILIGHITKDGGLAGPKTLEHIVDTVLYLESETNHDYKILRASKNRFGPTNEIGIFEMTARGFKEVSNPSLIFMEKNQNISGSVISSAIKGTRPFLIEVQALVTKTAFGYPQRKASGFDLNRLMVLVAVLTKRANLNLTNQDVILNVVGGLKLDDPGLDLAVCLAMASSLLNQIVKNNLVVLGEVGLGGEIRPVIKLEQKLKEAERLGFEKAIIPENIGAVSELSLPKKIKLIQMKNVQEIIGYLVKK
ncbi:DNA repair protein RadA [Candidatus Falkowbacteria bacterium RIFCSPLOWO2_12_FULL_45_13]|uniref:DNA repair protein RadA n=1 Tax=Candidatus Falkowbacteria bacterium RIFCSPLOWO2_12_FULL_45_13 TaxID=1797991 RepID=A0A1F5SYJ8_9BACT|nr:MAG: DNA repair protein RadA [Candidatus Falkowbacteria bacterium RIFCSPLOWO2_12_FULL_45_13]